VEEEADYEDPEVPVVNTNLLLARMPRTADELAAWNDEMDLEKILLGTEKLKRFRDGLSIDVRCP
jgi:hypothetical protein